VLGVVTALLPNMYAYAGESQASSMAGGGSTSQATTQETSQAENRPSTQSKNEQSSSAAQQASTSATTQSNNEGGAQPYQRPIGTATTPAAGRSVNYTMPAKAKPVVKNYGYRAPRKGPLVRNYK